MRAGVSRLCDTEEVLEAMTVQTIVGEAWFIGVWGRIKGLAQTRKVKLCVRILRKCSELKTEIL